MKNYKQMSLKESLDTHHKSRRSIIINIAKDVTDTMVTANSNLDSDRTGRDIRDNQSAVNNSFS